MSYAGRPKRGGYRSRNEPDYRYGDRPPARPKQPKAQPEQLIDVPAPKKVVIRNLPAQFTKDQFLQHVSPIPDYTYFAFHGPDLSLSNQARSRVYIRFKDEDDVAVFKEKFDGYIFLDGRGHELRCIVELAPYQRTAPQGQEKNDPKCGQILQSEEYKRFLEALEKKKDQLHASTSSKVQANLAQLEARAKELSAETTTPLMEFIKTQFEEREAYGRRPGKGKSFENSKRGKERPGKPPMMEGPPKKGFAGDHPRKQRDEPSKPIAVLQKPSGSVRGEKPGSEHGVAAAGDRKFDQKPPPTKPIRADESQGTGDYKRPSKPAAPSSPRGPNPANRESGGRNATGASKQEGAENKRPEPAPKREQIFNPITGTRETVSRSDVVIAEPVVPVSRSNMKVEGVEKSVGVAEVSGANGGDTPKGRIPNKARPSVEIYQPKARRRYQN